MPLDLDKILEAQEKINQVIQYAGALIDIINRIKYATIKDKDGSILFEFTADQKNKLVQEYEKRKTELEKSFKDLP